MFYLITADAKVTSYTSASVAKAACAEAREKGDAWCVGSKKDLTEVPTNVLVLVYNRAAGEPDSKAKTITKFSDRVNAEKRTWPVVEYLAKPGSAPSGEPRVKVKGAKKSATTKKSANGEGARGRPSAFAGKKISILVDENPRREGTAGAKAFKLCRNGMTYEAYLAAGGERKHLAWDVDHGYVKLVNG